MGFYSALTLLFIVLKVTNLVSLSWWWVLAPAATYILLVIAVLVLAYKFPLYFIDRSKIK